MPHFRFHAVANVLTPVPGQRISVEVFSSVVLIGPPVVRVDASRYMRLEAQTGERSWRYSYVPSVEDLGRVDITGTTLAEFEEVQTVIWRVFEVQYAGAPVSPFGMFPFGHGYFASINTVPITEQDTNADPFQFRLRRGQEGPQVVASWLNPDGLSVKLLRRTLDFPARHDDPDATVAYAGVGQNYADIDVADGVVYYYAFFVEDQQNPGTWLRFGRGYVLALDNQPYTDWKSVGTVLDWQRLNPPVSPTLGDRYVVPPGALGLWSGQSPDIAEWDGSTWVFTPAEPRNLVYLPDGTAVAFRVDRWVPAMLRQRVSFYDFLEETDLRQDALSAHAAYTYAVDPALDGERFNVDMGETGRPTMLRLLKNFNLPYNESKGVIEYLERLYDTKVVDVDRLLHAAALTGFDDFASLDTYLRRFLIRNQHSFLPRVGTEEAVQLAIKMWLGTGVSVVLRNCADTLFVANQSLCPVITPTPDPLFNTSLDTVDTCCSFTWATLEHPRALEMWISHPFDPRTFIPQDPALREEVLGVNSYAPPPSPATGDRWLVAGDFVSGAWVGQENNLAEWDGAVWQFSVPVNRQSYRIAGTDEIWVYRALPTPGWWKAIPLESILRLEWWLRSYALADTVYFRFIELLPEPDPEPPPPPEPPFFDDFEEW